MFPEGTQQGLYHTADATLWFFHAIARYVACTKDQGMLDALYPSLKTIIEAHNAGTLFGIHVDPGDGLLAQGAPGYQLTWMDAKVDDVVVTPRRGKAVEINALWYNALRLMEEWAKARGDAAAGEYAAQADRTQRSFNERFWYDAGQYLYDVVDVEQQAGANDPKCRPNQIFAVSLPHPVLARERWEPVVRVVRERLLTPVGLRSLAPGDPDFKTRYYGDLKTRDAAYHQGTVWAWLAGPFIDAWLKVHPDGVAQAKEALEGFLPHLDDACIGSISEVFDADQPFTPRGCIAQAWSVAEVLRASVRLALPLPLKEGEECAMADDRMKDKTLGDIYAPPDPASHIPEDGKFRDEENPENDESMSGGSGHGQAKHSGSRDVTEGTTGGLEPETGGTRNYRSGSGATGTDIGHRPE
jgi:glycogen debranching enzyme